MPHLIVPVLAALLLAAVLSAQFVAAISPDNSPSLLPQHLGALIVGGWLVLGLVWLLALRVRNPAALEAGERIYVEGE